MATFWEIAGHSVDHMFSLYLTICNFSFFLFWFEGWILVLIALVPSIFHTLYFYSNDLANAIITCTTTLSFDRRMAKNIL